MKHLAYNLAILLGGLRAILAQPPPMVTVCQALANPQKYNGRVIALRGIYESDVDAGGLAGVGCDPTLVTAGYTWPSLIWLTGPTSRGALHKADFPPPDRAEYDRLAALLRKAGFDRHLYSPTQMATVTFIGLFETYDDLSQHVRSTSDGLRGFGFGVEAAAPAQLLVKSISLDDVVIEPKRETPKQH